MDKWLIFAGIIIRVVSVLIGIMQKLYKIVFFAGYFAVLITSLLPVFGNLDKKHVDLLVFEFRLDHLLHFMVYFFISIYYLVGNRFGLFLFERQQDLKFVLLVLLLGITTEVLQLWVPARAFNPVDIISNISGFGVGMGVYIFYTKLTRNKSR